MSRGIQVRDEYIHSVEVEEMKVSLRNMFELDQRPEAIIAGSDRVLVEILNFAKEHQLVIPKDLAVIGIDDVSFANLFTPQLTTISQPTTKMANKAVELLLQQIKGEQKMSKTIRFGGQLNMRQSH